MSSLTVLCYESTGDWVGPHQESRAICLLGLRPGCAQCANHYFDIRLQFRLPEQQVLCPRWELNQDFKSGLPPIEYEPVFRRQCLVDKPYASCAACPHSKPWELPRTVAGWWEAERAQRERRDSDE